MISGAYCWLARPARGSSLPGKNSTTGPGAIAPIAAAAAIARILSRLAAETRFGLRSASGSGAGICWPQRTTRTAPPGSGAAFPSRWPTTAGTGGRRRGSRIFNMSAADRGRETGAGLARRGLTCGFGAFSHCRLQSTEEAGRLR